MNANPASSATKRRDDANLPREELTEPIRRAFPSDPLDRSPLKKPG
jgi:hypothetical protein